MVVLIEDTMRAVLMMMMMMVMAVGLLGTVCGQPSRPDNAAPPADLGSPDKTAPPDIIGPPDKIAPPDNIAPPDAGRPPVDYIVPPDGIIGAPYAYCRTTEQIYSAGKI